MFCFGNFAMVRYELFSKSSADLRSIIPLLKQNSVTKLNLPNKNKSENTDQYLEILKKELPESDVCIHWSVKYRKLKTPEETHASFASICNSNMDHLLLVSGSRPSKSCDALTCLKYLPSSGKQSVCRIGVAYNPYFPGLEERRKEEERLVSKLKTGMVSSVWLQCGSDVLALEHGLSFLKRLQDSGFCFEIVGSLLIPSRRLLAQMKFRPWNGVFLSQEYLASVDAANLITRQIVSLYHAYGVEPLVETSCSSQADFDRVANLLHPASTVSSSSTSQQPVAATPSSSGPAGARPQPFLLRGPPQSSLDTREPGGDPGPAPASPPSAAAKRHRPAPVARLSVDAGRPSGGLLR